MNKAKFLITCPIFKDELDMLLPSDSDITIHLLDYKIHGSASLMKKELLEAISEAKQCDADICLLVGSECDCDIGIRELADDVKAKYPVEKNCIEIILGPERAKTLQKNRTSIFTKGWIHMIEKFVEDGVWTADDVRINLGYFDRLLLLDYGVNPLDDEDILSFYDLVQVPIDREHVHLNYFQKVLTRLLEQ
jgi:hypothetical protein